MVTQLNQWKQQNMGTDRWNTLFQLNPKTSSFYDTSNLPHDSGFKCQKNPLKQFQNIILLFIEGVFIVGHDHLISSTKSSSNHRACHSRLIGCGDKTQFTINLTKWIRTAMQEETTSISKNLTANFSKLSATFCWESAGGRCTKQAQTKKLPELSP